MRKLVLLGLMVFAVSVSATEIYKSVDSEGNVIFSDKPIPQAVERSKIKLPDTTVKPDSVLNEQRVAGEVNTRVIDENLQKKREQRIQADQQVKQTYVDLEEAKRTMQEAEKRWKEAKDAWAREPNHFNRDHVLMLEQNYLIAKAKVNQLQADAEKAELQRAKAR